MNYWSRVHCVVKMALYIKADMKQYIQYLFIGGGGHINLHINLRFFLFVLLFCCLTSCQPIKGRAKCYASLNLHVYDTTARGKLALCVYNLWTNRKLYIHFIQQDLLFVNSDVILYCGFLYEKLYLCNHDIHVPCSHKH